MRHVTAWCVLCLLFAAGTARAAVGDVFKVDGITYKTLTDSAVQVSNGTKPTFFSGSTSCVIPANVTHSGKNYAVTSIGDNAFDGCSGLTSVTFPASLTSIGNSAFDGCSDLTSVTFPASLTSIGNNAFDGCSDLASVTFSESLTSIGHNAFDGCSALTSVTFPASLTSIGNSAFDGCSALTSVTLPASLTTIGDRAFDHCDKLKSFIVPSENSMLTAVDGVLFLKDKACLIAYPNGRQDPFYTVPNELKSIGSFAFSDCPNLKGFIVPSENPALCAEDGVLFNKSKTVLMAYPPGKGNSYTVPDGVTSIGNFAFSRCGLLASVTLPASLTSIGYRAFDSCELLKNITYCGQREPAVENGAFTQGPAKRVLHVPNAQDGFDKSKWGASTVVYGHSKHSILYYLCSLFIVVGSCAYGIRKWRASVVGGPPENGNHQD